VRRWLILAVIVLAGCATAVDDQPTNLGVGPVDASSPGKDTGNATGKDTGGSAPDTSFVEDTGSTVEDIRLPVLLSARWVSRLSLRPRGLDAVHL
jgi:hypothetical protein